MASVFEGIGWDDPERWQRDYLARLLSEDSDARPGSTGAGIESLGKSIAGVINMYSAQQQAQAKTAAQTSGLENLANAAYTPPPTAETAAPMPSPGGGGDTSGMAISPETQAMLAKVPPAPAETRGQPLTAAETAKISPEAMAGAERTLAEGRGTWAMQPVAKDLAHVKEAETFDPNDPLGLPRYLAKSGQLKALNEAGVLPDVVDAWHALTGPPSDQMRDVSAKELAAKFGGEPGDYEGIITQTSKLTGGRREVARSRPPTEKEAKLPSAPTQREVDLPNGMKQRQEWDAEKGWTDVGQPAPRWQAAEAKEAAERDQYELLKPEQKAALEKTAGLTPGALADVPVQRNTRSNQLHNLPGQLSWMEKMLMENGGRPTPPGGGGGGGKAALQGPVNPSQDVWSKLPKGAPFVHDGVQYYKQ